MRNLLPETFSFTGRIDRKQYWTRTLLLLLANLLGSAILIWLAVLNYTPPDPITARTIVGFALLGIVMVVFVVATVTGFAAAGVRRLHDRGKSGWWIVLYYLVPHWLLIESPWRGADLIVPLAAGAVLLWGLIDLGMLPGQPAEKSGQPA